jgi:multisubunit Na+/H+ antiporter MnhG subunit
MGIDIKLPIGLMFTVLGLFLTVFGIFTYSDVEMYKRSLGLNINLILGVLMLVFGVLMIAFSKKQAE